jgi:hypothetical protein
MLNMRTTREWAIANILWNIYLNIVRKWLWGNVCPAFDNAIESIITYNQSKMDNSEVHNADFNLEPLEEFKEGMSPRTPLMGSEKTREQLHQLFDDDDPRSAHVHFILWCEQRGVWGCMLITMINTKLCLIRKAAFKCKYSLANKLFNLKILSQWSICEIVGRAIQKHLLNIASISQKIALMFISRIHGIENRRDRDFRIDGWEFRFSNTPF